MNKSEQKFFFELVKYTSNNSDILEKYVRDAATPEVLGQLYYNRVQGIAYERLKKANLLQYTNREFRNCLREAYEKNVIKNHSYNWGLNYLREILSGEERHYAMLKGAVLCGMYPQGYRCASDVDILVRNKDVSTIGAILINNGFKQGKVINGEFIPATRKDIIESKMLRGETVPYIAKVNMPEMRCLEVDINFSLDYKNGDIYVVDNMLCNSVDIDMDGVVIRTLSQVDFFLHLCAHLYKEATTYPWVQMHRDMSLYKYEDIYMMISTNLLLNDYYTVFERARELGLHDELCFVVIQTADLYGLLEDDYEVVSMARKGVRGKENILHRVIHPERRISYLYRERDIVKRFFSNDREGMLRRE